MFDFFRGNWQFERTVTSPNITMRGQAIFKPCNASILRYEERASYELKEEALQCHQIFFYKIAGDTLQIEKEDRTLLHEFLLSRDVSFPLALEHGHLCKEDLYKIRLTLYALQTFETSYTIRGPSTDYRMITTFTKEE